jgi:uncharacterized protein
VQTNHLADETSPYLRQHADNPVDWYPWGEQALELAKRENKPILLSVGYSACHWCHVMAHESFEDPATAAVMNRLFVNVKVDREERPDIDKVYQLAQQLITQRGGGWPLTMFLTPDDHRPFFGGTYFPNEARYGMPAFTEVLERVAEYYHANRETIRGQNAELIAAFEALAPPRAEPRAGLDGTPLLAARRTLAGSFDKRFGGFGAAPKFPHAASIERCLRDADAAHEAGADAPLAIALTTLIRMAEGGIYDQLGGGFARYSVDDTWSIPHFEKMLYDNGPLLYVYAAAAAITGEKFFAQVAGETADWMLRDMRSPEGGFYSSLDADSEGHEGKFYVWDRAELESILEEREYRAVVQRYGLDAPPNFEGRWHLCVRAPLDPNDVSALESARAKLLATRTLRVWPGRDEKVLTAWNALAIKGLALAARVLRRPDLAQAATAAVDFIHRALWRGRRLLATYKDGRAHLNAYLDDYAFLADALIELLETRWRTRDLEFACALADSMLELFADTEAGGFYFTATDHERLIHRSKGFSDESLPSGNAVAAAALTRLGYLLGEERYLLAAERTLRASFELMREHPHSHMSMINALELYRKPAQVVIVRGRDAPAWAEALRARYAPTRMVFAIPDDADDLPPALEQKRAPPGSTAGGTAVYICTGTTCGAPLTDLDEAVSALELPAH